MTDLEKKGFGPLTTGGQELPEEAPEEVQNKVEAERKRGSFEVDPDIVFPTVNLGSNVESIDWKTESERSIWEDAVVYRPNSNKTKQLAGLVVGLRFVIIRLRTGFFHFDNVNKKFLCKTIASFPEEGEEFNMFSDYPMSEPVQSPSEYDEPNKPVKQVVKKGTYGSKGMFCADCVKQGKNVHYAYDKNNELEAQYCKGSGNLLVAITGVYVQFGDKKTGKSKAVPCNFDEIYVEGDDDEEEGLKQLFETPPIVSLRPTQKVMNLKTRFEVWTQEHANSSSAKDSANYVPEDVQNIATYDRSLYEESLEDGKSYVRVIKDEGGYTSLYLGEHELFLADRTEDCTLPSQLIKVPMLRMSERTKDILENGGVSDLKKASYGYYQHYKDTQRTLLQEKGYNPRQPFTPKELREEEGKPTLDQSQDSTNTKVVQETFSEDTDS